MKLRSHHENKVVIHALFGDEDRALLDEKGVLPHIEHIDGSGTYEDTFARLGREVFQLQFLSVGSRAFALEQEIAANTKNEHHIIYRPDAPAAALDPVFEPRYGEPRIIPAGIRERMMEQWQLRKMARDARKQDASMPTEFTVLL